MNTWLVKVRQWQLDSQFLEDTSQWSTLGPLGPLATYSQPLSQTVTSGQAQQGPTCTPSRQQAMARTGTPSTLSQPIPSGQVQWTSANTPSREQASKAPRTDPMTAQAERKHEIREGEEDLRQCLARANIDETRVEWLLEEGFTSPQLLNLLTLEGVDTLLERRAHENIPLAQSLALKRLVMSENQRIQGNGAPLNLQDNRRMQGQGGPLIPPRVTEYVPPPPQREVPTTERRDRWDPQQLNHLFPWANQEPAREAATKLDYQDPTLLMRLQGKHASYHDITDFVPGFIVEKERVAIPGSEGRVVLETGPRRPALHKISLAQWNCANCRILDTLILEGSANLNTIPDYLAYSQKINRMAERFEWETVLLFDREYRQLQASVGMRWGVDVRHLSDIHLREKVQAPSQGQARRDRQNRGANKARANPVDPKSGKELCINFNRGQCNYQNCRYAHICSQCFESHAASTHNNQGNESGH